MGIPATPKVYVLEGGIKGWVAAGPEYIQFMDAYVESAWGKSTKRGNENEQEGRESPSKRTREGAEETGDADMAL